MEKSFEKGRENIAKFLETNKIESFPIQSAVIITNMEDKIGGNIEYKQ